MTRTLRYIPLHQIDTAERLGYVIEDYLYGTHHGVHSVMGEWICSCGREAPGIGGVG